MTHKVGAKGQVVIPKGIRDRMNIRPGDEVIFWEEDDHVALQASRERTSVIDSLWGRFAGRPLTKMVEDERRRDRAREDSR